MTFDIFIHSSQIPSLSNALGDISAIATIHPLEGVPCTSVSVDEIASKASAPYTIIYTASTTLIPGYKMLQRIARVMMQSSATWLYCDYIAQSPDGTISHIPTGQYLEGSIRDDFNFGPLICLDTQALKDAAADISKGLHYAALYALRLAMARKQLPLHLPETLYTAAETDTRKSGERQFDYVDPRNRARQIEMEQVATDHLKAIGAWLPERTEPATDTTFYPVEASVIIPVRNRHTTIADAVRSALSQKTDFPFNVIVVDNHSTDGTSEILTKLSAEQPQLIVITPERTDLNIGGCWDLAVNSEQCGRYAVQLDSDDLYSSADTLAVIVEEFHRSKAAMVIGSYTLTDFNLNPIPPGIIDHREWTDTNGHNNALRINGLGAPRAFLTSVLREIGIPNVSYGEDYALGLAISSRWRIGRIYDSLYLCRRWDGNSDSSLPPVKINANNLYKDTLRTLVIAERKKINRMYSKI